jgi:hypothetical protein
MKLRAYIGWFWLLLFANAVAPKNILHAFHAHEETCHGYADKTHVTVQHEHCAFLKLQLFAFLAVNHQVDFYNNVVNHSPVVVPTSIDKCGIPSNKYLRGPPAC